MILKTGGVHPTIARKCINPLSYIRIVGWKEDMGVFFSMSFLLNFVFKLMVMSFKIYHALIPSDEELGHFLWETEESE